MDYSYIFSDFIDQYASVRVINNRADETYSVNVRVSDQDYLYTKIGRLSSLLADLVDIAVAVYVSDWLLPRSLRSSLEICIVLGLRNYSYFRSEHILEQLNQLLHHYTGDQWYFEFLPRKCPPRIAESQGKLNLSHRKRNNEVALWSGGLDSLAGIADRIAKNINSQYTLVGSGINTTVHGIQKRVAAIFIGNKKYEESYLGAGRIDFSNGRPLAKPVKLIQIPIRLDYTQSKPPQNDLFRARGFVFKILGAVCALMEEQNTLYIYENGYGAINLPFTQAEVGLSHTRSVHPLSLIKMGEFISEVISKPFHFVNPYLFSTKAQMCDVLRPHSDMAFSTVSCDSRYRQTDQPSQCGYCSSCLLRRMALLAAIGYDHTPYVATQGNFTESLRQKGHFEAMDTQATEIGRILSSADPWSRMLNRFPDLRQLVRKVAKEQLENEDVIKRSLLQLYKIHVEEWNTWRLNLMLPNNWRE